jgi:S-DNA-T family DNA segregation ATPase FtsK/SpoIIIE
MTGLIKANFPSRVAFRVSSKIDSRTILDSQGAEKLLGKGDMLFMQAASPDLRRAHCPYVSDQEVEKVAAFLRSQRKVEYVTIDESSVKGALQQEQFEDGLYGQVCDYVRGLDEISISMLQRQYRIGFNRSARLIEKLETDGVVAPAQGSKPRKVRH